ncbi:MAG: Holliday junction branch migration protein RuvA [Patescibacteria group bacterium]
MIYTIEGKLTHRGENFVVLETGGLGMRIFTHARSMHAIPASGSVIKFFCHLHVRENALELYGFASQKELDLFESLISVSGVGPKSAIAILGIDKLENILAAIKENRPDLLRRASGIGGKTADRIVLELKNKVTSEKSESVVGKMETDSDLVETLVGLGYRREQAKAALAKVDEKVVGLEGRLKAVFKVLGKK